jgi:hypothetical protein
MRALVSSRPAQILTGSAELHDVHGYEPMAKLDSFFQTLFPCSNVCEFVHVLLFGYGSNEIATF